MNIYGTKDFVKTRENKSLFLNRAVCRGKKDRAGHPCAVLPIIRGG
jgi:hypothetical protein